ncbi:hypothetical protein BKA64DRAFT_587502 [Cadophora sp. MPI-SDFR-AT-0126]|nr:hypothetical protein BKA64DRAFT_587502 [Leotiomycetes sp. MPI-SDFR-AT-0126]
MEAAATITTSHSPVLFRSCDNCRKRKTKCGSEQPCANCRTSNLVCQYTTINSSPSARPWPNARITGLPLESISHHQSLNLTMSNSHGNDHDHGHGSAVGQGDCDPSQSLPPAGFSIVLPSAQLEDWFGIVDTIRSDLLLSIQAALPSVPILGIVNDCIALFMQYTFPTSPIVHEATVRADAQVYFSETASKDIFKSNDIHQSVKHMRAFTLVTAVCASTASVMPESLLPYGRIVAVPFFRSSRQMLKSYEEYDVEQPDSSSLSIRDLQYSAAQHITGRSRLAYHVMGQASLIAESLHLYQESSLSKKAPIESQLLRLTFWHLYLSDASSVCLKTRAGILNQSFPKGRIDTHHSGGCSVPLLDPSDPQYGGFFEERLLLGFHLMERLWSSAARIVLDMRNYEGTQDGKKSLIERLAFVFYDFIGIMDEMPPWLKISNLVASSEDRDMEIFQKKSFWVQRCTLTMTFHCLRLVILQQCIEDGLLGVVGLDDEPLKIVMRKAEWIKDFVETMEDIPFVYHQIKGEPSVQRIRLVGTILLEMIQNIKSDAVKSRMQSYFKRLLDILSRLNSKASEELVA